MYSVPRVILAHPPGCNQEFPYFLQISQYDSTLFPNTESYMALQTIKCIMIFLIARNKIYPSVFSYLYCQYKTPGNVHKGRHLYHNANQNAKNIYSCTYDCDFNYQSATLPKLYTFQSRQRVHQKYSWWAYVKINQIIFPYNDSPEMIDHLVYISTGI